MKPLHFKSAEDKGLSNWVTASLREAILSGCFEPGEKLDQELIGTELNVSRTPIREALKVLASEGFVEIRSYRGVYIPLIVEQDIHDVYEIRWVIEPEIARQAALRIPAETVDYLRALLEKDQTAQNGEGGRQYYEIDQEFHTTIASFCQNKLFQEILEKINNRIVRVRSFALYQRGTYQDYSLTEHFSILEALRARDAGEAGKMMERHLRNSAGRIIQYLNR